MCLICQKTLWANSSNNVFKSIPCGKALTHAHAHAHTHTEYLFSILNHKWLAIRKEGLSDIYDSITFCATVDWL